MTSPSLTRDLGFSLPGPSGHAVLLVHGMTGAPGEMKFVAKRLHRAGYSVAAPLLAGHGLDQNGLLATNWRDWLGTVASAFDALSKQHEVVHIAGICVGGALGLALAADEPRVASVAVYSPTYRYDGWNMTGWYARLRPLVRPIAAWPGVRQISFAEPYPFGLKDERLREGVAQAMGSVIPGALDRISLGAMAEMHDLMDHVDEVGARITQPVLIAHAEDDDMSHLRNAYRLRDALGGPVRLEVLDDCYHMVHIDRQREHVAQVTGEFFRHSAPFRVDAATALASA